MRLKMKNGSHRYDINRTRPRHGHKYTNYKFRLSTRLVLTYEAEFMKKLSSTKAELKKSVTN